MDPSPVKDHDVIQDYLFTLIWEIWPGANKKYDTYIVIKIQILSTDMEWNFSFDLKWTYANDLCTFNEVEYCFSGCEIVKPCPQTLSPMVDQLLGIRSLKVFRKDFGDPGSLLVQIMVIHSNGWRWRVFDETVLYLYSI